MANKDNVSKRRLSSINKSNRQISGNINQLKDQMGVMLDNTPRTDEIESLRLQFDSLLKNEINDMNRAADGSVSGFLAKLVKSESLSSAATIADQFENLFGGNQAELEAFLTSKYKNRLLRQSDIHEVTSQLNDLREAILITRDAIVSADVVEGHMSRNLGFTDNIVTSNRDSWTSIITKMESKFKIQEKIKNFIVPDTLEYGNYYAYIIPYSEIFNDFEKNKDVNLKRMSGMYNEKTLFESAFDDDNDKNEFIHTISSSVPDDIRSNYDDKINPLNTDVSHNIEAIFKNISVSNDEIPLPILEEGIENISEYYKEFVESTKYTAEKNETSTEKFNRIVNGIDENGIHFTNNENEKSDKNNFEDISDCYFKLIDPMHMFPIKIMSQTIGYYYVIEEDTTPITGSVTSTLYYNRYEERNRGEDMIKAISDKIVKSFDKKFLKDNIKFKNIIVEALNYYNLNSKKIKFQFIPADKVVEFKVNENVNGDGVSVLDSSLFYAKLYLMLLLFKIMSIVLYSNDTRVNYIRTGIDKNIANKIEEIARKKQQRTLNLTDLFSYTSMINKVGSGQEMYIPVGQSDVRGIETEILAGQDIQINNDFMEMLKKGYMTATGVPDVLMNYINEADFAKTLEMANNRFQGRIASLQLDFNDPITQMYKMLMRGSTNIPESVIESFRFSFDAHKYAGSTITNDLISNFATFSDFMIKLFITEDELNSPTPAITAAIMEYKKSLVDIRLPMISMDRMTELWNAAKIKAGGEDVKPVAQQEDESQYQ